MAIRKRVNRRGDVMSCKPVGSTTFNQQDREGLILRGWDISPITDKYLSETAFPPQGEIGEVEDLD